MTESNLIKKDFILVYCCSKEWPTKGGLGRPLRDSWKRVRL